MSKSLVESEKLADEHGREPLDAVLGRGRLLNMGTESWELLQGTPVSVVDRFIAVNHFTGPDGLFDIAEILLNEAFGSSGVLSDDHFLSVLLHSGAAHPTELNLGAGGFRRPNISGSIVFSQGGVESNLKGVGPFHSLVIYTNKEKFRKRVEALTGQAEIPLDVLSSSSFRDEIIVVLMKQLISRYYYGPAACDRLSIEELYDGICRRLVINAQHKINEPGAKSKLTKPAVRKAIEFMMANLGQDVSREEIATAAGVESRHFSRLFKQTTGMTPKRYLLELQVEKVRELLQSGSDLPLGEIAQQCGFYDQSHMGSEFRRQVGTTPDSYRRYCR